MAELATIARPYAEAVFETAVADQSVDRWSSLLAELAAVAANADVQAVTSDPRVSTRQAVELVLSLVQAQVDDKAKNLITVLAENDRLPALGAISEQFEALRAEREGAADARIESAFPVSEAELAELVGKLERRFKRKVRATVSVDPELIGGVRVTVGDEVIDASVRGKLAAMQAALAH